MKQRVNEKYVLDFLKELLAIPSPSGFCREILCAVERQAKDFGYPAAYTNKGSLVITVPGSSSRVLGLTAHVDTLGAMVRSINASGTLRLTPVGGFGMPSIEGEYCLVHTRDGRIYSGTILTTHPSVHVHADARDQKREEANMEVRLDEKVQNKEETEAIGIRPGDYISFEPRTVFKDNGWIKSRHLDDKAGVASVFGMLELLHREGIIPAKTLKIIISNYEEVGHGAAYIPPDIEELIAVDMGALGDDLSSSEMKVSICAKDSTGPYDYEMTNKLIRLAERDGLDFAVDIYPQYGSDASAAIRAGSNVRAALVGPGVYASHSIERTHRDALINTTALLAAYVMEAIEVKA